MQLTATLNQILPVQTGESKSGKAWKSQDIIIETEGQYSKKVCITFFGDKSDQLASLQRGSQLTVHFEAESREHNGKWYTKLNGWKIDRPNASHPAPQPAKQLPTDGQDDDLPF